MEFLISRCLMLQLWLSICRKWWKLFPLLRGLLFSFMWDRVLFFADCKQNNSELSEFIPLSDKSSSLIYDDISFLPYLWHKSSAKNGIPSSPSLFWLMFNFFMWVKPNLSRQNSIFSFSNLMSFRAKFSTSNEEFLFRP